jgi:hypothetical protein
MMSDFAGDGKCDDGTVDGPTASVTIQRDLFQQNYGRSTTNFLFFCGVNGSLWCKRRQSVTRKQIDV